MARIRSIKPEFWTAEQVMELSPIARLCFIGMWNFCDDSGVHPASYKTLKAEVFPSDDITAAEVKGYVQEMISQGLLLEYEVDGRAFWIITGWHHQKIDQPTYKHPLPDGSCPSTTARRRSAYKPVHRTDDERSPNNHRTDGECSPPERRGEEGKGKEEEKPTTATTARDQLAEAVNEHLSDLERLFPDIDLPVAIEKLLAKHHNTPPLIDPYLTALRWLQAEFTPKGKQSSRASPRPSPLDVKTSSDADYWSKGA